MQEEQQRLLDDFKPQSEAESDWLKNIFGFILKHHSVLTCSPAPSSEVHPIPGVYQLSVCAVHSIQKKLSIAHSLPVSYRLLSVSELVSQQHLSCVSNLSWSTNQQRAWAREAELAAPGHKALPRVNLLLIGCLTEGQGGAWRLKDSSGSVQCECLSPSPQWLNRPVFLPHWNYIPHNASGQAEGCLELIGPPVFLDSSPELGLAGSCGRGAGHVGVREAAKSLRNRVKGQRLTVCGEVGSVCPLLELTGTSFFCFTLTEETVSVSVLVQKSRVWWWPCVHVGLRVCVTALRVCALRGWRGNNILCVTQHSQLHTNCTHAHAHTQSQQDTPTSMMTSQAACVDEGSGEEAEPEVVSPQFGVRMKCSRIINYQGTVSKVLSEGAGLYVMDGTVGMCLSYQPRARRTLRVGDRVELHHVHFLYRPCPDLPPSMLCTCLRSSLRVTTFSAVGGASASRRPGDQVLPRLLLQSDRAVSDYLWACHVSSQLTDSLVPTVLQLPSVCLLSWRLMEKHLRHHRRKHRDIYSEMLDTEHSCPLSQYSVDPSVPQCVGVLELCESLQTDCWSSFCPRSLVSSDGPSMTRVQLNSALSWSCRTLTSDPRTGTSLRGRPLLLVGVLQLPSVKAELKHCLQLSDGTGSISCVVTETTEDRGVQGGCFNTAWIGCLVCVFRFTMVTERFLQSQFPSYQHLDQDKFITHKHCRTYLQFSLDHVHILSPSVAMDTYLRQKGAESCENERTDDGEASARKRKRIDEDEALPSASSPGGGASRPCISMVISVESKEGVAWRNTGARSNMKDEEAGLRLHFSVKAAVIGSAVSWERDPKNVPITDTETRAGPGRVYLVFSGVTARWFPVLQTGNVYRLVAVNAQDPSALIGSELRGQSRVKLHADSTLQVQSDWRFYTLTHPRNTCTQSVSRIMSVSEVLDTSLELVCFQGLLTERIPLCDRTTDTQTRTGVRLTVCDHTGSSLQVYHKLSHTPYPPGLLPGNTLLLSRLQRRLSSSAHTPPPPMMHLGHWLLSGGQRCPLARVKGHLVCFLLLHLQWVCSLCSSTYTQSCSSSRCRSTSSIFQAKAKVVVDDGTGEAHVWFSGSLVRSLLGLADSQWEGLQRALRVKGHIRIYPKGRCLVSDGDSSDCLHHFLSCVCSSDVVSRPISFTCRKLTNQRSEEVKRFTRCDRDFLTRLIGPLQLTCLDLHADSAPLLR
ncbi:CST complex subunit CTC1 isoform X2 [Gouania willdenowi]|uniref:CST complex subunit CTC1 n=1 Tax=Gouania willdenowi TaxID=441366 RepID=A0A8C5DRS0_GOUWI|nr:CST complex subunit CTC1 isoform X2 [Gouania willdenowi]